MTDLTGRVQSALVFAAKLHRHQRRKGTDIPYVSHLLGVASIALEIGADEDQAIAALLHDAVEDQGGAPCLAEIRNRFGDRVAGVVGHAGAFAVWGGCTRWCRCGKVGQATPSSSRTSSGIHRQAWIDSVGLRHGRPRNECGVTRRY